MSLKRQIAPGVDWIGAIDWNRRLFDGLIPLPDGTSYNSYLVRGGDKTALIDAVDPKMTGVLMDNLDSLGVQHIDYIISQHAEQDHSGAISAVIERYPDATVIASAKACELLVEFALVGQDRVRPVGDGEILDLGGKTLEFISAPWVHWPDTIFTYLSEDRILFTCDFLGSHLATSDLYAKEDIYGPAKRYYAEIMMPFRTSIRKHLLRISGLKIEIVAPSHGPLYNRPDIITDAYRDWASDAVKNEVLIAYVSMHGSTEIMVSHLISALIDRNIAVKPFDLTKADLGALSMALVDPATIVIGSPTVLAGPHPAAAYAAILANALRPKAKFASIIGSYGWGGKMVADILALIPNLKVELIEPVVIKGHPQDKDRIAIDALADEILKRHQRIGITQ